jgi:ribonuclease HI
LCLQRLRVPNPFINFYLSQILDRRLLCVKTAFGNTPFFHPEKGVPQGAIESPLLFSICYDVCLVRMKCECSGYVARTNLNGGAKLSNSLLDRTIESRTILTSYVDDIGMVSSSREDLQKIAAISVSFNELVGIRTNFSKSKYVVFNVPERLPIICNHINIFPVPDDEDVRFLGTYFSSKLGFKSSVRVVQRELKTACTLLKSKKIGPRRLGYVVSAVLLPSLCYRLIPCTPTPSQIMKLNSMLNTTIRFCLRLPRDSPRSLIHSRIGMRIPDVEEVILQCTGMNLFVGLQQKVAEGKSVRTLIALLQAELGSSINPFEITTRITPEKFVNPYVPFITLCQNYAISFKIPSWPQPSASPIVNSVPGNLTKKLCLNLVKYNICDVSQLGEPGFKIASRDIIRLVSPRGRNLPKDLLELQQHLLGHDSVTLPSISSTSSHPVFVLDVGVFVQVSMGRNSVNSVGVVLQHLVHQINNTWKKCDSKSCCFYLDSPLQKQCLLSVRKESLPLPFTFIRRISERQFNLGSLRNRDFDSVIKRKINATNVFLNLRPPNNLSLKVSELVSEYFENVCLSDNEMCWELPAPQTIQIWTDGSLQQRESLCSLTCAVRIPFLSSPLSISAHIPNFHCSSTCAELWGIILAVSCVPFDSNVCITLDNQGIVYSMQSNLSKYSSYRNRLKTASGSDWSKLRTILQERNINLQLKWTKGHANDEQNNFADSLCSTSHDLPLLKTRNNLRQDFQPIMLCGFEFNGNHSRLFRDLVRTRYDIALAKVLTLTLWEDPMFLPDTRVMKEIFKLPILLKDISQYRFVLRTALNILPTDDLASQRFGCDTEQRCRLCNQEVTPNSTHALICTRFESEETSSDLIDRISSTCTPRIAATGLIRKSLTDRWSRLHNHPSTKWLDLFLLNRETLTHWYHQLRWIPYSIARKELPEQTFLVRTRPRRIIPCIHCNGDVKNCCPALKFDPKLSSLAAGLLSKRFRSGKDPDDLALVVSSL